MRNRRLLAVAAGLTILYALGVATNAVPALRGPQEWRWPYVIPGSFGRAWLGAAVLAGYLALIHWAQPREETGRDRIPVVWLLLAAGLMTPALQLALLYLDHRDFGLYQLFYRTVSELSGGFYNVGAPVTDIRAFLADFAGQMASYPVHPQRHPPGLPLLFALARGFFDAHPGLAQPIAAYLRPAQCHNLGLMNLPDGAIAAATLQMAVPALLGFVVWPLYVFGRQTYGEAVARRAALLWPLVPSVALWATRWNQLYGAFTLLALVFAHRALARRRPAWFLLSGLAAGASSFFSFGNVVIVLFVGLYALVYWLDDRERTPFHRLIVGGILFTVGAVLPWVVAAAYRVNFFAVWREAMGTHLSLGRSYVVWLFYHPYDFFVFLGIPLAVFWAGRTWDALRHWRRPPRDVLALSFLIGLIIVVVSGTSQGEVARVWAFLMPLALLVAIPRGEAAVRPAFTGIAILLALQLFVANIFLRPVSTGLLDPPTPPAEVAPGEELARWRDGPELLSASFPQHVDRDDALTVELVWSATAPSARPYTVFVHLVDKDGRLVAQDDRLPMSGAWPTTCWRPGEAFMDVQTLAIPDDLPPGEYRLLAGLYWLPELVRLPLVDGGDVVELGEVWVGE
ncbi:MAG: glycosyltransferase family 39 protein [Anaerolineae bacterium]|nr:glycosyltransferase family 39 protein [Anaerolineae bacterium]